MRVRGEFKLFEFCCRFVVAEKMQKFNVKKKLSCCCLKQQEIKLLSNQCSVRTFSITCGIVIFYLSSVRVTYSLSFGNNILPKRGSLVLAFVTQSNKYCC